LILNLLWAIVESCCDLLKSEALTATKSVLSIRVNPHVRKISFFDTRALKPGQAVLLRFGLNVPSVISVSVGNLTQSLPHILVEPSLVVRARRTTPVAGTP
jgi:hypothetical protein